jgi:RND family efflux transporter MFP subunit
VDAEFQRKLSTLKIDRNDEPAPSRRGLWITLALVSIVLLALTWWWLRPRAEPVRLATVTQRASQPGGASSVLNASGYVTARRQATVSSKFTGKVLEVLVEEGMKVEQGQLLARLEDIEARQSLALALAQLEVQRRDTIETEARLREANLRKRRLESLVAEGISSQADWDAIEAETAVLQAQIASQQQSIEAAARSVDQARQQLKDTEIRAPFAGVAISKNAQPGEIISPMSAGGGFTRTGISTIVDMSSLEIEVDVNEAYIQRVLPGQRVQATLDAYPEWQIPARVITTIPAADRQKATVTVRIAFDQLDSRLLPDMGVKVSFLAAEQAAGAAPRPVVAVPRAAVRGAGSETFVLVVGDDQRLERRAIRLAAGSSDPAEVAAGLSAGERVVMEGSAELAQGSLIEPLE